MTKTLTLFILLAIPSLLMAQITLNGTVIDSELNEPLFGVNVFHAKSAQGTVTDFDGKFTMPNLSIGDTIAFSYTGYRTLEYIVNGTETEVTIDISEDVTQLNEVVVIGYGASRKKDITGSVAVLDEKAIEELNPTQIEQALQGQIAGVNITAQSGSPGAQSNIRIRGVSTNGDNRPLILVDGNVIEDLTVLNPADIESINVLKDATAGIYGVRAANGVILITTKTGRKNSKLSVEYNGYAGFQETTRQLPVLNATEYALLANEAFAAGGQSNPYPVVSTLGVGTDWQEEVFETAPITNHNITLSGGSERITYSIGGSYLGQDGIVGGDKANFERISARLNLNIDVLDNLKFTINGIYNVTDRQTLSEGGIGSVLFNALNNAPAFAVRDANGEFTLAEGLGNEVVNPIAQIANTFNNTDVSRFSGKLGLSYTFLKNFTFQSNFQFNTSEVDGRTFNPIIFYGSGKVLNNTGRSSLAVNNDTFDDYTFDNFVNYNWKLGTDHNFQSTLGMSVFRTQGQFSGTTLGFFTEQNVTFETADIDNTVDQMNGQVDAGLSGKFDDRLLSYFGRLQYDYKGKYLVSAVLRRDGSSKFGPENRFGYFPSIALGWIVSEENFLANSSQIDFLKLRFSYGVLGNDRIRSNSFRGILDGEGTYVLNNQLAFGQAIGVLSNPQIQWEEQRAIDIGLDFNLFNYAITVTSDYYKKTTEGLLLQPEVSGLLGPRGPGTEPPFVNGGAVENSGFELTIGYDYDSKNDFSLGVDYNIAFLNNEVTEVNNNAGFLQGGSFGVGQDPPARMEAGKPIGFFFGLETDGVFQNQAEVDAHAEQANTAPGDIRFIDQNNDGIIDSDDRVDIGNPIPEMTMGLNLSVNFKNFDFQTYSFASLGNEIIRNYERNQPLVNRSSYAIGRWTGEGSTNTDPRLTTGATSNTLFSDFFVEDGSFLRIQNAQLGYTFPTSRLEGIGIKHLRLYVSVNNIHTFTEYRGYDPSASAGDPIGAGIDQGFYPLARTYLFGLNIRI